MNPIRLFSLSLVKTINEKIYERLPQSSGIYDKNFSAVRYPVSNYTGLPCTDSGRLMDVNLSPVEKEKILASLSKLDGRYLPKDLTDKEIWSLVPPRYFTDDPVDVQKWRDYISDEIMPQLKDEDIQNSENTNAGSESGSDSSDVG